MTMSFQAARRGKWKAVRYGREVEVYDLEKDPGETRDLAGRETELREEFRALFEEFGD